MTRARGKPARVKLTVLTSAKQYEPKLCQALHLQVSSGLRVAGAYVAAGAVEAEKAMVLAARKGATPILVLEGPTSLTAVRLPRSLILFPLDLSAPFPTGSTTASVAQSVSKALAAKPGDGSLPEEVNWSVFPTTFHRSGEKTSFSADVTALQAAIAGQKTPTDTSEFWRCFFERFWGDPEQLKRVLEQILSQYCVWFSPYTDLPLPSSEALEVLEIISSNWQQNSHVSHCYGAQYWNHPAISATFSGSAGKVVFHETQQEALAAASRDNGQILSWAGRTDSDFEKQCADKDVKLLRIEDGFLRSVGLGAGLARGAMLAVDDQGIYYDPSRASRLETLLREYELSEMELERGQALVELIKSARVSKYNFGKAKTFAFPSDKTRILVPGQVADDAAIRKSRSSTIDCANTPNVNLDLLALSRSRNPDAFIVFKPHPDVETGLRKGRLDREVILKYADEVAMDANIIDLIDAVDAVETFSSLSGFEALLREKQVNVHGAPFYAGWGLCNDLTVLEHRSRRRTLAELVYLSLVKYARTIDPVSLLPCSPEFLITRLAAQRDDKKHLFVTALKRHSSWLGRKLGI